MASLPNDFNFDVIFDVEHLEEIDSKNSDVLKKSIPLCGDCGTNLVEVNNFVYECPSCGSISNQSICKISEETQLTSTYLLPRVTGKNSVRFNEIIQNITSSSNRVISDILIKALDSHEDLKMYANYEIIDKITSEYNMFIPSVKKGRKNISILSSITYRVLSERNPLILKKSILNALKVDEKSMNAADKTIESSVRTGVSDAKHIITDMDKKQLEIFKKLFKIIGIDIKYLNLASEVNDMFSDPKIMKKLKTRFAIETGGAVVILILCEILKIKCDVKHILDIFSIKMPSVEKQIKNIKSMTPEIIEFIVTEVEKINKK
jgi:predicted RNA-binding Zn-ribbon protein involved in translation (DUF1610 family)